jgi:hypothetical protein
VNLFAIKIDKNEAKFEEEDLLSRRERTIEK